MDRVWRCSKAAEGRLLVLLAIGDFANDGGEAWPSVPALAKKSRLSDRQTQRVLKALVRLGELKISKNKGPHGCHRYQVTVTETEGDKMSPVTKCRGDMEGARGDMEGTLGVTQLCHPNRHRTVNKNRHATEVDSDFIAQQQILFPHLNVEQEEAKARAWISARPGRRMTRRFFVAWLNRANPQPAVGKKEEW
jgi:hypothetical protein